MALVVGGTSALASFGIVSRYLPLAAGLAVVPRLIVVPLLLRHVRRRAAT